MTDNKKNEALKNYSAITSTEIHGALKNLWDSKIIKTAIYIGAGIAVVYIGRIILNQAAEGIRSYKNFKSACLNQ